MLHKYPKEYEYHKVPAPWIQLDILKILAMLGRSDAKTSAKIYDVVEKALRKSTYYRNYCRNSRNAYKQRNSHSIDQNSLPVVPQSRPHSIMSIVSFQVFLKRQPQPQVFWNQLPEESGGCWTIGHKELADAGAWVSRHGWYDVGNRNSIIAHTNCKLIKYTDNSIEVDQSGRKGNRSAVSTELN